MADNCIICDRSPTVKSHLIPAALMHDQRADAKELWGLSSGGDGHVGLQSGYWERFLCAEHEAVFSKADRYSIAFCRTFYDRAKPAFRGLTWAVEDIDHDLLYLFVIGCIWRTVASGGASSSMGPYEGRLRDVLFSGSKERFPMILQRINHRDGRWKETAVTVLPHRMRVEGRSCWSFAVSGIRWTIKTDNQSFGPELTAVAAAKNPIWVLNRDPVFLGDDPDMQQFARPLGPRRHRLW